MAPHEGEMKSGEFEFPATDAPLEIVSKGVLWRETDGAPVVFSANLTIGELRVDGGSTSRSFGSVYYDANGILLSRGHVRDACD